MKITIYGTGSWGTALARVLADKGYSPILVGRNLTKIAEINSGYNSTYFGDLALNSSISATADSITATKDADVVVFAVPSKEIKMLAEQIYPHLSPNAVVINAGKGFDTAAGCRLSVTLSNTLPHVTTPVISLIGPSHAEEVIRRDLTSICAVSKDLEAAKKVQQLFSCDYFRVYTTNDEIGAEYGAAVKNVIALASGILAGRGYGDNAKAALVTRGLNEMMRYGVNKGGRSETFAGLTGLGDLVVTCFSPHSRNYRAGFAIGQANSADEWLRTCTETVEGMNACRYIFEDTSSCDIEMPIAHSVYRVLFEQALPSEEISKLMTRTLKNETAVH